jgi:hypothetical protein
MRRVSHAKCVGLFLFPASRLTMGRRLTMCRYTTYGPYKPPKPNMTGNHTQCSAPTNYHLAS